MAIARRLRAAAAVFFCATAAFAGGAPRPVRPLAAPAPGLALPARAERFVRLGAPAALFPSLKAEDRRALSQAFADFDRGRGDRSHPFNETLADQVVDAGLSLLQGYGEDDLLVAVGRSPLAPLAAAELAGGSPARFPAVPFSKGGAPTPPQLAAYRGRLARAGLSPRAIVERPGKTVLVDYVRQGTSLAGFTGVLKDWSAEEGVSGIEPRLSVHAFMDPRDDHMPGWERHFGSLRELTPEWIAALNPYLEKLLRGRFPGHPVRLHMVKQELGGALRDRALSRFVGAKYPAENWGESPPAHPHPEGEALLRFKLLERLEGRGLLLPR